MINQPLVSVLLPAYNAEGTISDTILSIINQTYTNWELIIINDGSKDKTLETIDRIKDNRIRIYSNDGNKGLIYSLNRSIDLAKGQYLARIDADDIALPTRLEKQVLYMESHQDVIVSGTFMETFGNVETPSIVSFETTNESIKEQFPLKTAFGHPSVIIRKSILERTNIRYDDDYKCAEDIKLWFDLMPYGEFANIPEVLMRYRISSSQCTQSGNQTMIENAKICRDLYLDRKTNGWFSKNMKGNRITIAMINSFKKKYSDRTLLLGLYRSMEAYQFPILLYSIVSFDILKFPALEVKNIVKRFLNKGNKVF